MLRDISHAEESWLEVTQLFCVAVDTLLLLVHLQAFERTQVSPTNLTRRCRGLGHLVLSLCLEGGEEIQTFPSSWLEDILKLLVTFCLHLALHENCF